MKFVLPIIRMTLAAAALAAVISCAPPTAAGGGTAPLPEDYVRLNGQVYALGKASVQDQTNNTGKYWVRLVGGGVNLDAQGYVNDGDGFDIELRFDTLGAGLAQRWTGSIYDAPGLVQANARVHQGGLVKNIQQPGDDGTYDLTIALAGGVLSVNGTLSVQDFSGSVVYSGPVVEYTLP